MDKNKIATVNRKNSADNSFKYAITVTLNHKKFKNIQK